MKTHLWTLHEVEIEQRESVAENLLWGGCVGLSIMGVMGKWRRTFLLRGRMRVWEWEWAGQM